jgi:hypothetical protein
MQLHCYLIDAIDQVLGWDVSTEACPRAVQSQAALLAGLSPEEQLDADLD